MSLWCGQLPLVQLELHDIPARRVLVARMPTDCIHQSPGIPVDDVRGPVQDELVKDDGCTEGLDANDGLVEGSGAVHLKGYEVPVQIVDGHRQHHHLGGLSVRAVHP